MGESKMAKLEEKLEQKIDSIDKDELKKQFDISHFDLNAILRGAQLTLVGAHRALQNPEIFTNSHYKQAAIAVAAGLAIRLAISIPIIGVKLFIAMMSLVTDLDKASWDETVVDGLELIANHVLQVPLFLMTLMSYITPTMDNMFMMALEWVDKTYVLKHKDENPEKLRAMYYPNLNQYSKEHNSARAKKTKTSEHKGVTSFIWRYGRKAAISLGLYALSCIPYIGALVLPATSFYTFNKAVGLGPAAIIFGTGIFLPKRYLIIFLQTYFSSRSLMRELLEPYFSRIYMTKDQKKKWFRSREGLLFGFGVGFYTLIQVPLFGVLIYGIAEASTAYLITKITDPPPPANAPESAIEQFTDSQQVWKNKHEFLNLSLDHLDAARGEPPSYEEAVGAKSE